MVCNEVSILMPPRKNYTERLWCIKQKKKKKKKKEEKEKEKKEKKKDLIFVLNNKWKFKFFWRAMHLTF